MEYTTCLNTWVSTLKHLGAAIAVAFKDTRVKAQQMLDNQNLFVKQIKTLEPTSPDANYLLPFCLYEHKWKVEGFNGDYSNKKPLKKFKKGDVQPWMAKYTATSRNLWRN